MGNNGKIPHLRYRTMNPPGGLVYRDLDTNVWIQSLVNIDDLIQKCIAHRRANELPVADNFAQFIESSICYSIDPALVLDMPDDRKVSDQMLTLFAVNRNTNAYLLNWRLKAGMQMVDQDEANARAETCMSCEYNQKHICLSCKGTDKWINSWTGRSTNYDAVMGVCACDGVVLYATLHSQLETKGEFPEWCWKRKVCRIMEAQTAAMLESV